MTSSAIMGNELSNAIANNSKEVSKKNSISNTKHESFSKIMEKNNYSNKVESKNKYENDNLLSSSDNDTELTADSIDSIADYKL